MAEKKGGNPRTIPGGKTQVNFNIENETLEKVKAIAYAENATNSEIYNLSVKTFIDNYERRNGKIRSRPKGKGLNGL